MEMMLAAAMAPQAPDRGTQVVLGAIFILASVVLMAWFLGTLFMTLLVAPNVIQKSAAALRDRNVACFFAGLLPLAAFVVLAALGFNIRPPLGVVMLIVFGVLLIPAYAAAAEDIGRRLFLTCGKEASRGTNLAVGWLVFACSAMVPVIGWFVVFPYVTLSGLGSVTLATISSNSKAPTAEPPKA